MYSAEEDISDVLHEVDGLAGRWSDMCLVLGLHSLENKIKAEHSKNPSDCLRAVVDKWLQKNYNCERFGSPTWKTLVKAVADPLGGANIALAENIAKKHISKCFSVQFSQQAVTALDIASQAVATIKPLQLSEAVKYKQYSKISTTTNTASANNEAV